MTLTGDTGVRFSELEQPELIEYRPLNRFAFAAFVIGWLSSLALLHPVFCILPMAGVIVSLLALRQFRSPEIKQSGRNLAISGLALALLFGSWAVARESSREMRMYKRARVVAEEWLELMRSGKLHELHQLTLPEEKRAAGGVALSDHYKMDDHSMPKDPRHRSSSEMMEMMSHPHFEFDSFFAQPLARKLRDLGEKAQYNYREAVQLMDTGATTCEMQLIFDVRAESNQGPTSFPIRVTVVRNYMPGVAADWYVSRIAED